MLNLGGNHFPLFSFHTHFFRPLPPPHESDFSNTELYDYEVGRKKVHLKMEMVRGERERGEGRRKLHYSVVAQSCQLYYFTC